MTVEPGWGPPGIDSDKANIARVYDYWLGGTHHVQADRDLARTIIAMNPDSRRHAQANRAFLGRAVRYLGGQGIRQFLDIGSGLPTGQNVHEVAQRAAPGARVVYVDNDEVAVAHSRLMLEDDPDTVALQADLREPERILAAPETQLLLDFSQPVAVVLSSVMHFIPDDAEAAAVVAALRDALAPGSHLVVGHICMEGRPDLAARFEDVYNGRVDGQLRLRTREEIKRLCEGFEFLDPGLVWTPQWRPDSPGDVPPHPENYLAAVGVARTLND